MQIRNLSGITFALVTFFAAALSPIISGSLRAQEEGVRALDGEWLYVKDLTEDRDVEKQGPPMSAKFILRVEKDGVVMPRSRGDERITLDGSTIEVGGEGTTKRYSGQWNDGMLEYKMEVVRDSDDSRVLLIRREFRVTPDGLLVTVTVGDPSEPGSKALYRHPNDIEMPEPATAAIADLEWLAGAWLGTKGKSSTEERWSPHRGGAMLGVSRTVSDGSMRAFEFLRIVERDGGLVYFAQPGGNPPTEFVLTELDKTRAVFENPRHDFPQRIVYELSEDGRMSASIGFINGGRPRLFEFVREDN